MKNTSSINAIAYNRLITIHKAYMRKTLFLFMLLLSGWMVKAQEPFYYYKGEKIPLALERTRVNLRVTANWDEMNLRRQGYEVVAFFKDHDTGKSTNFITLQVQPQKYDFAIKEISKLNGVTGVFPSYKTVEREIVDMTDYLYVKLQQQADVALLRNLAKEEGVQIVEQNKFMPLWYTLKVEEHNKSNTLEIANKLFETAKFLSVVPDFISDDLFCSSDPFFNTQWGLMNTGQNGGVSGMDIDICNAWTITQGANITVAVLDTGIELTHPDLANNIHHLSYDTESNTSPSKVFGDHGTHCAGIVGAVKDNNIGVAGVAPKSKLMSISNSLAGSPNSRIKRADGLNWAWQNGADVITNSWGSAVKYQVIDDAIENAIHFGRNGKGCIVVFASGNNNGAVSYPANSNPKIFCVGSIDNKGRKSSFSNFGSVLDITAPGTYINSTVLHANYGFKSGTSMATPHVAGVAALVLSVAPNLTELEVRNIIESTAKKVNDDVYEYNYIIGRPNGKWNSYMGYGLVNAYQAVLKAKASNGLDLHVRNSIVDIGAEPDTFSAETDIYQSPDIWVRVLDDGQLNHQNPEYHLFNKNFVYVRVRNISNTASTAKDSVRLHWAKASTALSFPRHWDGSFKINNVPMGGVISTQPMPILQPGAEAIVKFAWNVPNPKNYQQITPGGNEPWHFCLLARILSDNDVMTFVETTDLASNVRNNNNIAWKNLSVVDVSTNKFSKVNVLVKNPELITQVYTLQFVETAVGSNNFNGDLFKQAEVRAFLGPKLMKAWMSGGSKSKGIDFDGKSNEFQILQSGARLDNIILAPDEYDIVKLSFNFLTAKSNKNQKTISDEEFLFHLIQTRMDKSLVGGEAYLIRTELKGNFAAYAGLDQTASHGERVYLEAGDIGEPATYNWYDSQDTLLHTGKNYDFIMDKPQKVQLEVIAEDGTKDYDEVEIFLKPNSLDIIVPNPASKTAKIYYNVGNATQAYISLLPVNTSFGNAVQYPIIGGDNFTEINVTSFKKGLYKVSLFVDNKLIETKSLLIE